MSYTFTPKGARRRAERERNAAVGHCTLTDQVMADLVALRQPGEHIDHIIPLAKGGAHHPLNLQILPAAVNMSKGADLPPWLPTATTTSITGQKVIMAMACRWPRPGSFVAPTVVDHIGGQLEAEFAAAVNRLQELEKVALWDLMAAIALPAAKNRADLARAAYNAHFLAR